MASASEPRTLKQFLESLQVGDALSHLNLALVPLSGNGHKPLDYILAADAIEAGTLVVTELDEGGSVPDLLVTSSVETMVFVMDGEELVGAKQNRILNTSILFPPRAKTKIPVSCSEQGRWHYRSRRFRSGGTSSSSRLRRKKSRSVGRSLRATGKATSDQGEVWDEVHRYMEATGTSSPTAAMHDAVEQRRESLDAYMAELKCPENARGVVVAIDGEFEAMDLFDKPETLEKVWHRLVRGYALDAIVEQDTTAKAFTSDDVRALLSRAAETECQPCPSVGIGDDWRFETDALVGQALVAEGTCVHLSVFPSEGNEQDEEPASPIQPPSRRARHSGSG